MFKPAMEVLMKMPRHEQYEQNRDDGRYRDWQPFCCNQVEVKHQGNSGRYEEERHVGDKKFTYGFDGRWIDDFAFEQKCQNQHPPDAAGNVKSRNERKEFAERQTSEYYTELFCHWLICKCRFS